MLVLDIDNTLLHSVDTSLTAMQRTLSETQRARLEKERWVYVEEKEYYLLREGPFCYKTKPRKHLKRFLE